MSVGTFLVVTSEMMPVGLLTPMASSLETTEGTIGQTLTITGVVAAVSAPGVPLLARSVDRRNLLAALMVLLFVANAITAWAPTFSVVVVARVLLGVAMGGVWAIAAGLAPRLVAGRSIGSATATIFSGVAFASVLGVPLGTFLGAQAGWRTAFLVIGAVGLLVAIALLVSLPRLPVEQNGGLTGMSRLLRNPRVITGLSIIVLLVGGHFAAYTYVRPALELYADAGPSLIGTLLLVYGIAGAVGNFVAGPRAVRAPRATVSVILVALGTSTLLMPFLASTATSAGAVLVLWGLAYGGASVTVQAWMMASAPGARETVSSLGVGVFNLSIALGATTGGVAVDGFGATAALGTATVLALAGLLVALLGRAPRTQRPEAATVPAEKP
ncbi:MFS transporter [Spiractinospora alimapuensis]|nr:MFS transporter [Spiractinospora alimapuensis]